MNTWYRRSELWTTVGGAIGIVLADGLGLKLEGDTLIAVTGLLVSYALGRGFVKGKVEESTFGSTTL